MGSTVNPTERACLIHERCAGQLRTVLQSRGAPILRKARRLVFRASGLQGRIGEEFEKVEILKTHRSIRSFVGIADAECRCTKLSAKFFCFRLRPDCNEAHAEIVASLVIVGLAQLREWFRKERSTDVPQPDNERWERGA